MWVIWLTFALLAPSAFALLFVWIWPGILSAACGAICGAGVALLIAMTLG